MMFRGRAHRFGSDISTDSIIPTKYKTSTTHIQEMTRHVLEDVDPDFYHKIAPGDFIVAGSNFGCGSSREAAPRVIKAAGISAVLAKGFARIFFRNSINLGLPLVECDTSLIDEGDELEINLGVGVVHNRTKGTDIQVVPLPPVMVELLSDGGLAEHFRRHGTFNLQSIR